MGRSQGPSRVTRARRSRGAKPLAHRVLLPMAAVGAVGLGFCVAPDAPAPASASAPLPIPTSGLKAGEAPTGEGASLKLASAKTGVGGMVINSAGKALAGLRVTVTAITNARGALYGSVQFQVTTNKSGRFMVTRPPAALDALSWKAEASFPWYGGTWERYLTTVSDHDPAHLVFRSDLTSGRAGYAQSATDGSIIRLYDPNGCGAFGFPGNTANPATDPRTSSILVTLTPDGRMLDGSVGHAYRVPVPSSWLCLSRDSIIDVPAGAWYLTAVNNIGRKISFSFPTNSRVADTAIVFNEPEGQNTSPVQEVDIHFADQTGG